MKLKTLKNKREFDLVFEKGKRHSSAAGQIIIRSGTDENRVGIIVSRSLGGAVKRNRIKRLVREAYRKIAGTMAMGSAEIVIIPRPAVEHLGQRKITECIAEAFRRSGIKC